MKHVIVIGGGFAGIQLVCRLARNKEMMITLVDRNNYCFFPPLLYQVATGFLETSNIAYPYRRMLRKYPNIRVRMGELLRVVPDKNTVVLCAGEIKYDQLVIATGATTNYFGINKVREAAFPMKTLGDALKLRNHLLEQVERAAETLSDREKIRHLTIIIAGNGPTGVEIAGMLANMQHDVLYRDHPDLKAGLVRPHIMLVGNTRVLSAMSEESSQYCLKSLTGMGVDVRTDLLVKDYTQGHVVFSNGEAIETETLIWAAGVTGQRFGGFPGDTYGPGGRIRTDPFNRLIGLKNIYAIGDSCIQTHETAWPNGHPQMAQVAIQQGRNLARNLAMKDIFRQQPFCYNNKGSMAIIGRNKAVVDLSGGSHLRGFVAWSLWLGVHLFSLMNLRNRITTFFNWAVAYLTRDQSLRMIVRPSKEKTEIVPAGRAR